VGEYSLVPAARGGAASDSDTESNLEMLSVSRSCASSASGPHDAPQRKRPMSGASSSGQYGDGRTVINIDDDDDDDDDEDDEEEAASSTGSGSWSNDDPDFPSKGKRGKQTVMHKRRKLSTGVRVSCLSACPVAFHPH
jgi:hypothetical protein